MIYHYTNSCKSFSILISQELILGKFRMANDPKEIMPAIKIGGEKSEEIKNFVLDEFHKFYEQQVFFASFVQDCYYDTMVKWDKNEVTRYSPYFGKGFNSPRMWAQYGGDHAGACIILDKKIINNQLEELKKKSAIYEKYCDAIRYVPYIKDVENHTCEEKDDSGIEIKEEGVLLPLNADKFLYLDKDGNPSKFDSKSFFIENYHRISFQKLLDWRDEKEYRIICLSEKDKVTLSLKQALKAVILGCKNENTCTKSIIEQCKKKNIPLYKIEYLNGSASLKPITQPSVMPKNKT
jgi:hypothetical protein